MIIKLLVNYALPTASGDVTLGYGTADSDRMREAAQRSSDILDGAASTVAATEMQTLRRP